MANIKLKKGEGFSGLPGYAGVISRDKRKDLKRGLPVELSVKETSFLRPGSYEEVQPPKKEKSYSGEVEEESLGFKKTTFKKSNK